jgi:hypothetical protein
MIFMKLVNVLESFVVLELLKLDIEYITMKTSKIALLRIDTLRLA